MPPIYKCRQHRWASRTHTSQLWLTGHYRLAIHVQCRRHRWASRTHTSQLWLNGRYRLARQVQCRQHRWPVALTPDECGSAVESLAGTLDEAESLVVYVVDSPGE